MTVPASAIDRPQATGTATIPIEHVSLLLQAERTLLAWYRTGFASLALGLGLGRLLPLVTGETSTLDRALSIVLGLLGIGCIAGGLATYLGLARRVDTGDTLHANTRLLTLTGGVAALLGAGITIALVAG